MNLIILEGPRLYWFLALILLTFIILFTTLMVAIVMARRNMYFERVILNEKKEISNLKRENFILKLKCGDFEIDDA